MALDRRVNAAGRAFFEADRGVRLEVERRTRGGHHRAMRRLFALVVFGVFAGCVPLSYTFTPSSSKPISKKPDNCKFEVFTTEPTQGYEEIGVLELYNGDAPKSPDKFRSAVAEQVCGVGGDGVIAIRNDKGVITKGQVIHFAHFTEPVKPISETPATQSGDTENPNH